VKGCLTVIGILLLIGIVPEIIKYIYDNTGRRKRDMIARQEKARKELAEKERIKEQQERIKEEEERSRDRAAHEVLDGTFDFESEFSEILSINNELNFTISSERLCPRCRALLVDRYGRRGPFMGCPNYPECRFTRSL
jgi:hypothetical protein